MDNLIGFMMAVLIGSLMKVLVMKFTGSDNALHRMWLALDMQLLVALGQGLLLSVILGQSGVMAAFGPAIIVTVISALIGACLIVLCYVLRKKRSLSETQRIELNAM